MTTTALSYFFNTLSWIVVCRGSFLGAFVLQVCLLGWGRRGLPTLSPNLGVLTHAHTSRLGLNTAGCRAGMWHLLRDSGSPALETFHYLVQVS